jgi:hypothetical protein
MRIDARKPHQPRTEGAQLSDLVVVVHGHVECRCGIDRQNDGLVKASGVQFEKERLEWLEVVADVKG